MFLSVTQVHTNSFGKLYKCINYWGLFCAYTQTLVALTLCQLSWTFYTRDML